MNKYYRNIIAIILILIIFLTLFPYWLNLNFGYWQIILIFAGAYGIYLNVKAKLIERNQA
ncbi:hypothetical protein [Virgibacillus kimchii]